MRIAGRILALLPVLLTGCVEAPEKQYAQRIELVNETLAKLNSTDPCCKDLQHATIHGQWPTVMSHVQVGDGSDVGVFGSDKVYFVGLELPAELPSRHLLIKERYVIKRRDPHAPATILSSLPGVGSAYIMQPHLAFLDTDHQLISEATAPVCLDQGWDRERTGFFAAATAPSNAKYVIVFTRPVPENAGLYHKYSGGGGTVGFSFTYSGTMKVYFGPSGDLDIGIVNDAQLNSLRGSRDQECAEVLAAWGYRQ